MLDIKLLREEPDKIKYAIASKKADSKLVDAFLRFDEEWRTLTAELEGLRAEQKKKGEARDVEGAKKLKEEIKRKEEKLGDIDAKRDHTLRMIPNPPLPEVPKGASEHDNVVLREVGSKPRFDFPAKDYLAIAEGLGIIDMERGAKISGSRFGFLLGGAARLEFALVQFALETLTDKSLLRRLAKEHKLDLPETAFIPVVPPVLINRKAMSGMGYLDRGADEIYHLAEDDLYLAGTSEQPMGAMHADEVFEEEALPRRYMGFSTCFRREAGSYGKDTKGILRVHQFDKIEMFSFTTPEKSREEHKLLLAIEEYLMHALGVSYHVLNICTADLGDPAAAKFDVESWMPGQNGGKGEYRETHSTSNTTDYQARRLNVKYKPKGGDKPKFLHMLNGTAFAVGRTLIAIIENYQTKEGKIEVPKALQKYAGEKIIG